MDSSGADPRAHGSRSVVDILGHTIGVSSISLREIADDISPLGRFWNDREMEPLPAQIGRYRLAGEIARGGGGSIHRARDVDLGRDVALKVLLAHHRENPEVIRRFIEEAQIGGQLQHPGIVPVHEMGLFAGKQPYFAMKLVRGKTLARLLEERQGLSEDRQRFLGIFEHICQTLAFAHARGVIHRDLKPSNVMVGTFGEVQVMDWGLAKVLSRQGPINERSSTEGAIRGIDIVTVRSEAKGTESIAGSVLGTPAYMAPEQARGEMENLDERTDVFGLGAILCEILTGEPPYTGETVDEVHQQAQRGSLHNARARIAACGADREVLAVANRLSSSDATREESLRYWTAVRALRPDDPSFALALGHAYQINGLHEKALLEYAEALRELPGAWRAEYPLRLLEREDLSFSDRTLDDFILRIERLPASSKVHIPRTWEVLAEAQNRRYRGGQLQNAVDDARRHVRETAQRDPNALLMLSRLLWGAGRHVEAIRAAEESELIAGTSPVLRRYRQSLTPRLVSCASVEAAIVEAEGVGGGEAGTWRFSENSSTLNPEWLDPAFDDRDWNEGTGDFGWVGVSPSNHLVLRRQFVIADPKDFDAVGLVVYSTDRTLTVYINGKETSGELVAGPDVDGETRHSFDLASGLRAGTNTVVVDSLRTLFSRNRPRLRPILESQRRSESRAVIFDALRKRFSAKEDGYLFDYAEGRWLQLEGDFTAAAERFRAVLARERREALPFVRLWECLRETKGESDAFAEVRNEIEKAGPNALLPLSPQRPSAVGTEVDGCAVRLETSKFLHLDPRVVHVATRWQVRVTERDDVQDPVVDLLSYKHLTQISLPPHALEPETRYSWRAFHIGTTVETSRASEEVSFMTGKGRREVVPIDLAQHFNRDVVADRGDLRDDSIDDGLCVLIEQGYDGNQLLPGMPTDRRIGVHRLGQYDKPNAIQIDRDDLDPVRIEFPPHRFDVIRFLVTCGHGNANVPVIFEYTDGTTQRDIVRGIDWVTEPNKGALGWGAFPEGVQKLRNNMARMVEGRLSYGTLYGVFDVTIAIDGEKTLGTIVLEANKMEGFFERTHFNLFAITGVERGPSISRGL